MHHQPQHHLTMHGYGRHVRTKNFHTEDHASLSVSQQTAAMTTELTLKLAQIQCLKIMSGSPWIAPLFLTLSIPSKSKWVAFLSPSNIGAKRSKVGVGQEKPEKMLTFRQLPLQCCHHSLTWYHSPPPQLIQNQAPIHRQSSALCSQSPSMKNSISLTSHHIFADLTVKTT